MTPFSDHFQEIELYPFPFTPNDSVLVKENQQMQNGLILKLVKHAFNNGEFNVKVSKF